jgi:hypothetical protein
MAYPELAHFGFKCICGFFMFNTLLHQSAIRDYKAYKLRLLENKNKLQ